MALEDLLKEHTVALKEHAQALLANTAALKVTGENQERLIAGQAAAMAKIEGPKATRGRPKADAVVETKPEPEAKPEPVVETKPAPTDEELRAAAAKWLGDKDADPAAYKDRGNWMKSMMMHLGSPKIVGPESTLDDAGKKQAAFYLARKSAGHAVDFSADYDFDGDIAQGAEAAGGDESDDDMIG